MDAWIEKIRKVADCVLRVRWPQVFRVQGARGADAEALAARYLQQQGMQILARNVRCKGGEIDIITLHQGSVVFVEVRLRRQGDFGGAAASITRAKQKRIILAARHWLAGNGRRHAQQPCRFDVVLFDRLDVARIQWITGAFDAG